MSDKQPQIQFNLTLPALNALIEAQPEAKTKLTHGVIENFAKQHFIKVLQNEIEISHAIKDLKDEAVKDVLRDIGITANLWARHENITIADRHVVKIKEYIQKLADDYIKQAIDTQLAGLQAQVEMAIAVRVADTVNAAVRNRLRLVEANIRELTEAIPLKRSVSDTTGTAS